MSDSCSSLWLESCLGSASPNGGRLLFCVGVSVAISDDPLLEADSCAAFELMRGCGMSCATLCMAFLVSIVEGELSFTVSEAPRSVELASNSSRTILAITGCSSKLAGSA